MKDRRKTRFRSDLKEGDFVARKKGWFIPAKIEPWGAIWGVYDEKGGIVTDNIVYYSNGVDRMTKWETDEKYIDFAPKGNFITKFVKRLKAFRQFEKLFNV